VFTERKIPELCCIQRTTPSRQCQLGVKSDQNVNLVVVLLVVLACVAAFLGFWLAMLSTLRRK
jgi:hypothetical protein